MAQQQILQFGLRVNADVSSAQSSLSKLKKDLLQLQSNAYNPDLRLDEDFKKASLAAQELQKHLNFSTDKFGNFNISSFTQSLKMSKTSLTELSASLLSVGNQGANAFQGLANQILNAQKPALTFSGLLTKMGTTLANNIRWQLSSAAINLFTRGIREAWTYTKDMDEALTNIAVVTGKSRKEITAMSDSLNKAARSLKSTGLEMAKSQLIFYQQGDSAELAAEKARITTMAANVSFESSAEEMADYLTAIWNSYQVGEDQLESFVDKLSAVGATTATSMEELATAMTKVAAAANSVGVTYDQLNATIATISSATRVSAESVGTAMKTIYARMGDLKLGKEDEDGLDYGQVSSGLKKMGIDILDAEGNLRDMGKVVEEVGNKWDKWTTAQQQAIVQLMAGKRQYTNLTALFDNWDQYLNNLNTSENAVGTLQKQQDTWAQSWEAASNRVKNSMQQAYADIINGDFMIKLANMTADVITGFNELIDSVGGLGPVLLQVAGIMSRVFNVQIVNFFTSQIINLRSFFNWKGDLQQNLSMLQQIGNSNAFKNLSTDQQVVISNFGKLAGLRQEYLAQEKNMTLAQKSNYESLLEIYKTHMLINEEAAKRIATSQKEMGAAGRAESSSKRKVAKEDWATVNNHMQYGKDKGQQITPQTINSTDAQSKINDFMQNADNLAKKYNLTFDDGGSLAKLKKEMQEGKVSVETYENAVKEVKTALESVGKQPMTVNERIDELSQKLASLNIEAIDQALSTDGADKLKIATEELKKLGFELTEVDAAAEGFYIPTLSKEVSDVDSLTNALRGLGVEEKTIDALFDDGIITGALSGDVSAVEQLRMKLKELGFEDTTLTNLFSDSFIEGKNLTITDLEQIIKKYKELEAAKLAAEGKTRGSTVSQNIDTRTDAQKDFNTSKEQMDSAEGDMKKNYVNVDDISKKMQGYTQLAGAMMSIVSAGQSVINMFKTLNDENATTGEKIMSVVSTFSMVALTITGSVIPAIVTLGTTKTAVDGAQVAGNTAVAFSWGAVWAAMWPVLAVMGAIAALVGIGYLIAAGLKDAEKRANAAAIGLEKAKENLEEMSKRASEATEKYNELKTEMEDYEDALEGLSKLKEGTLEFKEALIEANDKVLRLMASYPELAEYVQNNDGVLKISQEGWDIVLEKQQNEMLDANAMRRLAQLEAVQAQVFADVSKGLNKVAISAKEKGQDILYDKDYIFGQPQETKHYLKDDSGNGDADEYIKRLLDNSDPETIARLISDGSSDQIQEIAKSIDFSDLDVENSDELIQGLVDNKDASLDLIKQYQLNQVAIEENTKALYGINSEGKARTEGETKIATKLAKDKETELLKEYKDIFEYGGSNKEEMKELLAEHYGVSIDEIQLTDTGGGDMTIKVKQGTDWKVMEDFNHDGGSGTNDARYSIITEQLAKENAVKWAGSEEADSAIKKRYDEMESSVAKQARSAMLASQVIQDNDGAFKSFDDFETAYETKAQEVTDNINSAKDKMVEEINEGNISENITISNVDVEDLFNFDDETLEDVTIVEDIYNSLEKEAGEQDLDLSVMGEKLEEEMKNNLTPEGSDGEFSKEQIKDYIEDNMGDGLSAEDIELINTESMQKAITEQLISEGIEDADWDDIQRAFNDIMSGKLMVDPLDFSEMFTGMESAISGMDSMIDAMSKLQQGTALTKQEMFNLAQQYPQLLEASNLFTDGSVAGQQAMLDEILKVKEAEHDAEIDTKIAELEVAQKAIDEQIRVENEKLRLIKEINQDILTDEYKKQLWIAEYENASGVTYAEIEGEKVTVNEDAMEAVLTQTEDGVEKGVNLFGPFGEGLGEATKQGAESSIKSLNSLGTKVATFVGRTFLNLESIGEMIKAAFDPTRTVADYLYSQWTAISTEIDSKDVSLTDIVDKVNWKDVSAEEIEAWKGAQLEVEEKQIDALEEKKLKIGNAIENLRAMKGLNLAQTYGSSSGGSGGGSDSGDDISPEAKAFEAAFEKWENFYSEGQRAITQNRKSAQEFAKEVQSSTIPAEVKSAYNALSEEEKKEYKNDFYGIDDDIQSAFEDGQNEYYDEAGKAEGIEFKSQADIEEEVTQLYSVGSDEYVIEVNKRIAAEKTKKGEQLAAYSGPTSWTNMTGQQASIDITELDSTDSESSDYDIKQVYRDNADRIIENAQEDLEKGRITYSQYRDILKKQIFRQTPDGSFVFNYDERMDYLDGMVEEDPSTAFSGLQRLYKIGDMNIEQFTTAYKDILSFEDIDEETLIDLGESFTDEISGFFSSINTSINLGTKQAQPAFDEMKEFLETNRELFTNEQYSELREQIAGDISSYADSLVQGIELGTIRGSDSIHAMWQLILDNATILTSAEIADITEKIESAMETSADTVLDLASKGSYNFKEASDELQKIFSEGWYIDEINAENWNSLGDSLEETVEMQEQYIEYATGLLESTENLWSEGILTFEEGMEANLYYLEKWGFALTDAQKRIYSDTTRQLEKYIAAQKSLFDEGGQSLFETITNIQENSSYDEDLVAEKIKEILTSEFDEIIEDFEEGKIDSVAGAAEKIIAKIIESGYTDMEEINKILAEQFATLYEHNLQSIQDKYEAIELNQDVADYGMFSVDLNDDGLFTEEEFRLDQWQKKMSELLALRDSYIANYKGTEDIVYDETYQSIQSAIKAEQDAGQELADAALEVRENYLDRQKRLGNVTIDDEINYLNQTQWMFDNNAFREYFANEEDYLEWVREKRLENYEAQVEAHKEKAELIKEQLIEEYETEKAIVEKQKELRETEFDAIMELREAQHQLDIDLQSSLAMYEYLDEETRKLIFNEEDYVSLSNEILRIQEEINDLTEDYNDDILNATEKEAELLTEEYEQQIELKLQEFEIAKANLEVTKKQLALQNTLNERNTRMFINGQWTWVADPEAVAKAREEILEAQYNAETERLNLDHQKEMNILNDSIRSFDEKIVDVEQRFEELEEKLGNKDKGVIKSLAEFDKALTAWETKHGEGGDITEGTGFGEEGHFDRTEWENLTNEEIYNAWADKNIYGIKQEEGSQVYYGNKVYTYSTIDKNGRMAWVDEKGNVLGQTFKDAEGNELIDSSLAPLNWDEGLQYFINEVYGADRNVALEGLVEREKAQTSESDNQPYTTQKEYSKSYEKDVVGYIEQVIDLLSKLVLINDEMVDEYIASAEEASKTKGALFRIGNETFVSQGDGTFWNNKEQRTVTLEDIAKIVKGVNEKQEEVIAAKEAESPQTEEDNKPVEKEDVYKNNRAQYYSDSNTNIADDVWWGQDENSHGKSEAAQALIEKGIISEDGYFVSGQAQSQYYKGYISSFLGEENSKKLFDFIDSAYGGEEFAGGYYKNLFDTLAKAYKSSTPEDWIQVAADSYFGVTGGGGFFNDFAHILGVSEENVKQMLSGIDIVSNMKPKEETETSEKEEEVKETKTFVYTVVSGDTLSEIAAEHGVSVEDIMQANSDLIKDKNKISVGWQLKIPGEGSQDSSTSTSNPADAAKSNANSLLDVARGYLGTQESEAVEKFGAWTDEKGNVVPWCALFVSQTLEDANLSSGNNGNSSAGIDTRRDSGKLNASVYDYYKNATDSNTLMKTAEEGALVLFNPDGKWDPNVGKDEHIGIIESVNDDGTITVISGNQNNQVQRKDYNITDSSIAGYIHTSGISKTATTTGNYSTEEAATWAMLKEAGYSDDAAAAIMGNLDNESGVRAGNVQDGMGWTDEGYLKAVNNGTHNFVTDSVGYGLAQWTSSDRKQNLWDYMAANGYDINDPQGQREFLIKELAEYGLSPDVLNKMSFNEASNKILFKYENPAVKDATEQKERQDSGTKFKNQFGGDKYLSYQTGSTSNNGQITNNATVVVGDGKTSTTSVSTPVNNITINQSLSLPQELIDVLKTIHEELLKITAVVYEDWVVVHDGVLLYELEQDLAYCTDRLIEALKDPAEKLYNFIPENEDESVDSTLKKPEFNARGNIINRPTLSWVGEDGPEAIIPLSQKYRDRGLSLWEEATKALGIAPSFTMPTIKASFPQQKENMNVSQTINVTVQNEDSSNDFYAITNLL